MIRCEKDCPDVGSCPAYLRGFRCLFPKEDPGVVKPECIYIATRLTAPHPIEYIVNLKQSLKAGAKVWRKGHIPIVPGYDILMYLELDGDYGLGGRLPYEASLELMRRCDALLIHNGLVDEPLSSGVKAEYDKAIRLGMKIYMSLDEILEVTQ